VLSALAVDKKSKKSQTNKAFLAPGPLTRTLRFRYTSRTVLMKAPVARSVPAASRPIGVRLINRRPVGWLQPPAGICQPRVEVEKAAPQPRYCGLSVGEVMGSAISYY